MPTGNRATPGDIWDASASDNFTARRPKLGVVWPGPEEDTAYRRVKLADAVVYADGHVVCGKNGDDPFVGTNDVSASTGNPVLGILRIPSGCPIPTTDDEAWVQVAGPGVVNVISAATYVAGDQLIASDSGDGQALEITGAPTAWVQSRYIGYVTKTEASAVTAVNAMIQVPH